MPNLKDLVVFDIKRLFNGAIDVDWLSSDAAKATAAAKAFVFHGPNCHGVAQKDVEATGHKLIDSASFVKKVLTNIEKPSGNPFILAIAGFGSGKSHLAVTLSELLTTSAEDLRQTVISHLLEIDQEIALDIKGSLLTLGNRVLVLTLNGMNNCDLTSELLAKTKSALIAHGIDTRPLENLRKRFKHAANILSTLDKTLLAPLFEKTGVDEKDKIIDRLMSYDEATYKEVHDFLLDIGIPLNAIGDETAKDVLRGITDNYVGEGKTFDKMLIIFDEFGHYMEYATSHPQIAGDGALQHLFEGVQNNDGKVSFVGFVQYELKVYEQRLSSSADKNEIRRFITRFDTADKLFLSSNLETLVASLLVKKEMPALPEGFSEAAYAQINRWYPIAENYSAWHDGKIFNQVIAKGCWPLSPLAMWTLFHLSSSGQYLQQRSALALLKAALDTHADFEFTPDYPALPAVGLWTSDLQQEFEEVEEQTARGSVMQAFNAVLEKSAQHLSSDELAILRSMVLAAQTRLKASSLDDAKDALLTISGLSQEAFNQGLSNLVDELNIVAWDEAFKQFEILGDTVSRPQFMRMLQQKAANEYDEEREARLFIKAAERQPLLQAIECDFANDNKISTSEWKYAPRYTFWILFKKTVTNIVSELKSSSSFNGVDVPRGIVVYCFVPSSEDETTVLDEAQRILKAQAANLPLLLVLLIDNDNDKIAKSLVDLDILETLSSDEKEKYNRLIVTHERKQTEILSESIRSSLLKRHFLTAFPASIAGGRLSGMGEALFSKVYSKPLPFPFDGYATPRGNAARDCADFTRKMFSAQFTYDDIQTMPIQQKNRANNVLKSSWKVFAKDGSVVLQQSEASIKKLIYEWDSHLAEADGLNCAIALKTACAAPYGANIASAGLLFATYIQARQSAITVMRDGVQASFQNDIDNVFSGLVVDPTFLSNWALYKSEGGDSEWDSLLTEWGNCTTYRQIAALAERKEELAKRLPIPIVLRVRVGQMENDSKMAKRAIAEQEQREADAEDKIANGIRLDKVSLLTWGASLLCSLAKKMLTDTHWNREEDTQPLVDQVNIAKQHIIQRFDAWISTNRPYGNNADALTEFKRDMLEHVCGNLKNLDLAAQREKLEKYVERIAKAFEFVADASQKITSADNWLAVNSAIPVDSSVAQLDALARQAEQQSDLLKEARTSMKRCAQESLVSDLSKRIDRCDALQSSIKQKLKEIQSRAARIWKTQLKVDTVSEILDEAKELEHLYTGSTTNIDDFRIMRNVAASFYDSYRQFDTLQFSPTEYNRLIDGAKKEFIERFAEDEPPWDLEACFTAMLTVCRRKRQAESEKWFTDAQKKADALETFSLQDADMLHQHLMSPPVFFDDETFSGKLNRLSKQVEKYLESKGVAWLFEKYTQLTPSAQKIFLKMIKNGR